MKVSVVIPTLNGGALFRDVLERIFSQKLSHPFEVICVDSGSSDHTSHFAEAAGAKVIPIDPSDFNHGLTRNLGIEASTSDFVALTVQDALPCDENWLASLVHALLDNEDAAGAYSRQIPRDDCDPIIRDRLQNWSATRTEREIQSLAEGMAFDDLAPFDRLALIAFDNVSSCIRRSVWEDHPFPKRNFGEDVTWASEVIKQGYSIVFEPASAVVHSHNNSVWYEFKRIYADHQNLNQLIGLRTVPHFRNIISNGKGAFLHYKHLIRQAEVSKKDRIVKTIRAFPYAYLENLAQYLGARLHHLARRKIGLCMGLDRWLKRGV